MFNHAFQLDWLASAAVAFLLEAILVVILYARIRKYLRRGGYAVWLRRLRSGRPPGIPIFSSLNKSEACNFGLVLVLIVTSIFLSIATFELLDSIFGSFVTSQHTVIGFAEGTTAKLQTLVHQQADMLAQIKEALRFGNMGGAGMTYTSSTSNVGLGFAWWDAVALCVLVAVGIYLISISNSADLCQRCPWCQRACRALGSIFLASPIGFTAFHADSLIKIDHVQVRVERGHTNSPRPTSANLYLVIDNLNTATTKKQVLSVDCGPTGRRYYVGPFGQGSSKRMDSRTREKVQTVAAAYRRIVGANKRNLIGLFLMGSADPEELSAQAKSEFGTNSGLAQQRANWVRGQLVKKFKNDPTFSDGHAIITLNVGPIEPQAKYYARDRKVAICALSDKPE